MTTQAYGQQSAVALAFQDSGGAENVSSLHWIPFMSEGIGLAKDNLQSQDMRRLFDEGDEYEGPNSVDGDLEMEAQPIAIGAILRTIFGSPTSTAVDSAFQHVYELPNSDFDRYYAHTPVTYYKDLGDAGSAQLFYDLNVTQLQLSVANGELLKATASFVGGKQKQTAALTPSFPTGKRWTWDAGSVSVAGSAVDEVAELTFTVNDNLEAQHTLKAQKTPSRIKRTDFRTVEIGGTLRFETQDEYQKFLDQSERELDVTFMGNTEIASGHYDTLRIQAPLMRYRENRPAAGGVGPITVDFTAGGKYSTDSGTALRVTLVNTQSTY